VSGISHERRKSRARNIENELTFLLHTVLGVDRA